MLKTVLMLNPDGVVNGNYRTGLAGIAFMKRVPAGWLARVNYCGRNISGLRAQGMDARVSGSGCGVQGSGSRVDSRGQVFVEDGSDAHPRRRGQWQLPHGACWSNRLFQSP